jgi:adenylate kinase
MSEVSHARMLIVGPPGAGKGTQAGKIGERFGVPVISTGDIFRSNIKEQTELGKEVQAITERGELVPDELTNKIVADRLAQDDARAGFLLDGYPRTVEQVHALDSMLADSDTGLDAVILLEADTEEVVDRLLKRAHEQGRADDTEDVVRHRQEVYAKETSPLIELYGGRGLLVRVDGLGEIEEVSQRIARALDAKLEA